MMTAYAPRIGVIGAGYWGLQLIRNCSELGVLVAVCDASAGRLEGVSAQYPQCAVYQHLEALWRAPLDAVVIATPAETHAELTHAAISHGKHVLVEKPLALRVEDGIAMVEHAREAGVQLCVGHQLLYHPAFVALREAVRAGEIGDIRHIRSQRCSLGKLRSRESVWWSFAPHDLAVILSLYEDEPLAVAASHSNVRGNGAADVAYADFVFPHGRSAHVTASWFEDRKLQMTQVFGSRGIATFADSRQGATVTISDIAIGTDSYGEPTIERLSERLVPYQPSEPLENELRAFIHAIVHATPALSSGRHGLSVLRALSMADCAAATTHPIERMEYQLR